MLKMYIFRMHLLVACQSTADKRFLVQLDLYNNFPMVLHHGDDVQPIEINRKSYQVLVRDPMCQHLDVDPLSKHHFCHNNIEHQVPCFYMQSDSIHAHLCDTYMYLGGDLLYSLDLFSTF
jgi:hypothetical protein